MFLIHFSQDIYKEFLHTEKEKDHYFRILVALWAFFKSQQSAMHKKVFH